MIQCVFEFFASVLPTAWDRWWRKEAAIFRTCHPCKETVSGMRPHISIHWTDRSEKQKGGRRKAARIKFSRATNTMPEARPPGSRTETVPSGTATTVWTVWSRFTTGTESGCPVSMTQMATYRIWKPAWEATSCCPSVTSMTAMGTA